MKKLLGILVLGLLLITPSKADDISDFEIEGMSIGDSLLDYFGEDQIKEFLNSHTTYFYNNSDYATIGISSNNQSEILLKNYKSLGIVINKNDKKYKILSIAGQNYSFNDINDCRANQKSISNDIKKVLGNNFNEDYWENDKYESNEIVIGKTRMNDFLYDDGSAVRIICYELNEEARKSSKWKVKLEVILNSKEFNNYIMRR